MNCRKPLALLALLTLAGTVSLAATRITRTLVPLGTVTLRNLAPASSVATPPRRQIFMPKPHFGAAASPLTASQFPVLSGVPIVGPGTRFHGFNGMDALTSGIAQGFTLEPPDQ